MEYKIRVKFIAILLLLHLPQNDLAQFKNELPYRFYPPFLQNDHQKSVLSYDIENYAEQNDSNMTSLGRWAWGHCYAVAVRNNYAYIGNGGAFQVLDILNPALPRISGEVNLPDLILGITIAGNFAYIADWAGGMRIIDISAAGNPAEVGFYKKGQIFNVVVEGMYAYLADSQGSLFIVDVSSPSNPIEVGSLSEPGYFLLDVAVAGNYAYLVGDFLGMGRMLIVDISNPFNPTLIKRQWFDGVGTSATILEKKLFVTSQGGYLGGGGLLITDISIPSDPMPVNSFRTNVPLWDVVISGQYAYTQSGDSGIEVFDIINSTVVARFNTDVFAVDGSINGNYLYIADFASLNIIDISVPDAPILVGEFDTGYFTQAIVLSGNYAFVADGLAGIWVLDVSAQASPVALTHVRTRGYARSLIISDNQLYLAIPYVGIEVFDISVPSNPSEIGFIPLEEEIYSLTNARKHLYTACGNSGVWIIEASSPYRFIGQIPSRGLTEDLEIVGDYIYIADGAGGLRIIDVSVPENLQELSVFKCDDNLQRLSVSSNYAFVLCSIRTGKSRLLALDLRRLPNISVAGSYQFDDANEITVSANYAYVFSSGLRVLDISNPNYLHEVGFFYPEGSASAYHILGSRNIIKSTVVDNKIYLPFGSIGFYVLQNDLITSLSEGRNNNQAIPLNFYLLQNQPNPFNSNTTITYTLPTLGFVTLKVYNTLGQAVRTLVDGIRSIGRHQITWDGMDDHGRRVARGLYICQLNAGQFYASQKISYLD